MTTRPYFDKSISELEVAFEDGRKDRATLHRLLHELEFRNTQRAIALKEKILGANDTSGDTPPPQARQATKADGMPPRQHKPVEVVEPIRPMAKAGPKPPLTNNAQNILRAWTALEVLSPQGFRRETDLVAGDKSRIARFEKHDLPWELGERSRPKKRLYYELILGAVALGPAVESLLKVYADKRPDKPSMRGFCPIASILLDKEGRPLEEENSFAISSFAWGVPIALKGDLKALAEWPHQETSLKNAFRKILIRRDRKDEILPLTKRHIAELFEFLVDTMSLNALEVKPPYFALRRYEFFASKTPPEPGLLNSFFLEDLATARIYAKNGTLPHALRHYLAVDKPPHKTDLLREDAGLQNLLQPALTPLGRWPGNGRFPLALLQQAAVNATAPSLMETGILAVNGPPGTGKTTLLRDVVAARIIERASVMCSYKNPADAFAATSQSLQRNGAKITLHKLDEKLKGFEMVVTSSNNKAVENVSAELPALDAIATDAPQLRYFKTISDNVLERKTWGAIAAVLGNSSNRYVFSQSFWRDDENGLSTYLNHASGIPQVVSERQENGPPIRRNREIVDRERPPANAREAAARWETARTSFLEVLKSSRENQAALQTLHVALVRLVAVTTEINDLRSSLPEVQLEAEALQSRLSDAQTDLHAAETKAAERLKKKDTHFAVRPGLLARLFLTRRFKDWSSAFRTLENKAAEAARAQASRQASVNSLNGELTAKQNLLRQLAQKIETLEVEKDQLEVRTERARSGLSIAVPDTTFFSRAHDDIQTASVWFDKAASILRDDVFEAAIHLHRAFIDGAADPLRQNLSIFVESFGTRSLGTPQKDALITDLWASFFLVVPVVSTTFASVNRMFSRLGPESLGWLLVDEAGQALPQAAVGAMLRTKRSVVVGDPLQIEPVVTLPNSLTEEVCGFFGIDPLKYNAPEASVQTVADSASLYCARFPIGSGHRDVGAPLLVHRRCNSPMFDISNEIAYANLMVQAKKASPENAILGPSKWIDVQGKPGPDKWCADEAVVLIDGLNRLKYGGAKPDLYVVTPFVIVQDNLRQEILKSRVLDGWVENPNAWVWEHVGTVHTVQGREAEIVFFVLGAQMSSQNGARAWAGGRPNLVNVAVTRAKVSLYVIGNRQLWKSAGAFAVLDRYLPDGAA
ncbi:AAA domain-containing protein [Novosphingobium sp. 1949]|uniref:AAA domain-containing protein n=1 Tax=Novosphingobium organovorum TaxID=2930092 RepID=A0ABT0BHL2_9SPHN|nr:ATP-binding protein [Novosphingobium organovorum]MCJ2184551.1 AAA domain-containing protein [Novosphingobium organovorum]